MEQAEAPYPLSSPLEVAPLPPPKFRDPVGRHVVALVATLVTTTFFGAFHWAGFLAGSGGPAATISGAQFWLGGLWFSLTVLAILGTHEAGHYLACRYYDVDASLPWFLPAPLPLTGTLGAFIRIRSPIPDKRALFDIAVAGPFAGFIVALPLLAMGIASSHVVPLITVDEGVALGRPLIYRALEMLILGTTPEGFDVFVHPMALAAWFGLLATALNLFPLGQLDGGHVAYAVFGEHARGITLATAAASIALAFVSSSWLVWAALVVTMTVVSGGRHPPTRDDSVPLDSRRRVLAVVAALVFVLCFTPTPIEPMALVRPPVASPGQH